MAIFSPFNQIIAEHRRTFIGLRGAIGGVALRGLKQYATEHGYKDVKMPFCHLDLEGALYIEGTVWNHMGFRIELGPRYTHPSFTGAADQNKIKQSIGLHCRGGHLSTLLYVYPGGRFADNGSWNGHIGINFFGAKSKGIATSAKTKKNEPLDMHDEGFIMGVGFEFISGLQIECRYRLGVMWLDATSIKKSHGISLGIGYVLFK